MAILMAKSLCNGPSRTDVFEAIVTLAARPEDQHKVKHFFLKQFTGSMLVYFFFEVLRTFL